MRHTFKYLLATLAVALFVRCISEYEPPVTGDADKLLVVEGVITDDTTNVKLSWSVGLPEDFTDSWITDARVWVESEDGRRFEQASEKIDPHTYSILTGTLDEQRRYRLCIAYGGEEYASEYRYPQPTPPFELSFRPEGRQMQVLLNVQGEPDGPRHFLWNYEETWEAPATFNATHYISPTTTNFFKGLPYGYYKEWWDLNNYLSLPLSEQALHPRPLPPTYDPVWIEEYPGGISPWYYCWKHNRSNELLIGSTELLTENTVRDHVLYEFLADDDRLFVLYHTKVTQYAIGEDAYFYYDNQKKHTDETGSIFAPIPSEMQGNVLCTTSPEIPVIGFVEVSKRARREVFRPGEGMPESKMLFTAEQIKNSVPPDTPPRDPFFYTFYLVTATPAYTLYTTGCIDCREQGGSKERPEWWPNDHY